MKTNTLPHIFRPLLLGLLEIILLFQILLEFCEYLYKPQV